MSSRCNSVSYFKITLLTCTIFPVSHKTAKTQNCSHKSALHKRRNWFATNDCQIRLNFFLLPVIIEAEVPRQSNKQLKLSIKVTYSIHYKLPLSRKLTPFFTLHLCDRYILLQTKLYKHKIIFVIYMSSTIPAPFYFK